MLPNRFFSSCVTSRFMGRLTGFALMVLAAGTLAGRANAGTLPSNGVDEFRQILVQDRNQSVDDLIPLTVLADRRNALRAAATRIASLGDVGRVLLLPEWGATDIDADLLVVSLEKVEMIVNEMNVETFKREVKNLVDMAKDESDKAKVTSLVALEIKRDVRLKLLKRFEDRCRLYLESGTAPDRIAAANLIGEMMTGARKQDNVGLPGAGSTVPRKTAQLSSNFLRQRLRGLSGDLRKLTAAADPQVQAAGVRALGNVETNPALSVPALRPMLDPSRNVIARRATAEALGHMVEITYLQMQKDNPVPTLGSLEQIFPAAAIGLTDADTEVRRLSLDACRKAATALEELVPESPAKLPSRSGLLAYKPMAEAVERTLPSLNRAALDPVPELRVSACHLLETLALTKQKMRRLGEIALPAPRPETTDPVKPPDKSSRLPAPHGRRHLAAAKPSQWAMTRSAAPPATALLTPVAFRGDGAAPATTLDRPVKLPPVELSRLPRRIDLTLRPTAFVVQKKDELPPPSKLEVNLKGTVEAMIDGLADPDYRVRQASVDVLETFGDRAVPAIPALVKALSDPNRFVRWAAARTLGKLNPRQPELVVPVLTGLLNDREDLNVRLAAAHALELYGPAAREAVPHLARVINRGDREYVIAILHTLQGIGTDAQSALPAVAWILRNQEIATSARVEAAQTLGRFGDLAKKQIGALREAMIKDPDEEVRQAASAAVLAVDRKR